MKMNAGIFDTKKAEAIVAQLLANAAGVRYGTVSVSVKLHEGRLIEVSFSKIERILLMLYSSSFCPSRSGDFGGFLAFFREGVRFTFCGFGF